jgi:hypothetical protein
MQPVVEDVGDNAIQELSTKILSGTETSSTDIQWWQMPKGQASPTRLRFK